MAYWMLGAKGAGAKAAAAMGKSASAAGGAAVQFSKNLGSITKETWKEGGKMFQMIRDIDWDKPQRFFNSFYEFMSQFGIISEFITPLMDMFDIMDAAIIRENADAIIWWNRTIMDLTRTIDDSIGQIGKLRRELQKTWALAGQGGKGGYGGARGGRRGSEPEWWETWWAGGGGYVV